MAAAKKEEKPEISQEEYWNEKVTVVIPRDKDKGSHVVVGINGRFMQIQRGVPVQVSRKVASVLRNSMDSDLQVEDKIASLSIG